MTTHSGAQVFTIAEIARAAGVTLDEASNLFASRVLPQLRSGFIAEAEAVDAVRLLRMRQPAHAPAELFAPLEQAQPERRVPILASSGVHAAVLGALVIISSIGASAPADLQPVKLEPARLVFLALPGPGGGGGGGGLKQPRPATRAELKGKSTLKSPVPTRTVRSETPRPEPPRPEPPVQPVAAEKPVPPPPPLPHPDPAPPVVAPVVPVAGDATDRAGDIKGPVQETPSRGTGTGGGSGSGSGTGNGEGTGPGIGDGSGGGTGGGPYRPGSGITPPQLLREVKPIYTDEARRRGIEGEVVLEVIVRSDGSVGSTRVLRGLGAGLDQSAITAVRQWRFAPARRHGTPVDVIVEIGVEFAVR